MSNFDKAIDLAVNQTEDIKSSGRHQIAGGTYALALLDNYSENVTDAIDYICKPLKKTDSPDSEFYPLYKMALLQQAIDLWTDTMREKGHYVTSMHDLIDIIDSKEDYVDIESRDSFVMMQQSHGLDLMKLKGEIKNLKGMLRPETRARFIPAFTWKEVGNALISLKMILKNSKDGELDEKAFPSIASTLEQGKTSIGDFVSLVDELIVIAGSRSEPTMFVNALEFADITSKLCDKLDLCFNPVKFNAGFMTAKYAIVNPVPDFKIKSTNPVYKDTKLVYKASTLSLNVAKEDEAESAIEMNLGKFIGQLVGALLNEKGCSEASITLPLIYCVGGPIMVDSLKEWLKQQAKADELEYFKFVRAVAPSFMKRTTYAKFTRDLADVFQADLKGVVKAAAKFRTLDYSKAIAEGYEILVKKRGTFNRTVYCRDEMPNFTVPTGIDSMLKLGSVEISAQEGAITNFPKIPVAIPAGFTEAVLRREAVGDDQQVTMSVPRSEFTKFIEGGFEYIDHKETSYSWSFDAKAAMKLLSDVGEDSTNPLPIEGPGIPSSLSTSEVLSRIPFSTTKYHIEDGVLLRYSEGVQHSYTAGLLHIPFSCQTSELVCSNNSGWCVGFTHAMVEANEMMGLAESIAHMAERLLTNAFALQQPELKTQIKMEINYSNLPYSERDELRPDEFKDWTPNANIKQFLSHPVTHSKAVTLVDVDLIHNFSRYAYEIHKGHHAWLKGVCEARMIHIRRLVGSSKVFALTKKYLEGSMTRAERTNIKANPMVGIMFNQMLELLLEDGSVSSPLGRLIMLSTLLDAIDNIADDKADDAIALKDLGVPHNAAK